MINVQLIKNAMAEKVQERSRISRGAVHRVRHAWGWRGSKKVWQFVTGRGEFKSMWRHAFTIFYLTY